ncbi:undecaprenyl/decaprenyl-phosphate alpha-N-acetylglucosaminyl 1-phosphate transferase [bacterium]|nr:undecaprenyl/decaprenyl-phosphate alpha-N-acetylglucosaminyl 1-phosphate transferase [bacterium]
MSNIVYLVGIMLLSGLWAYGITPFIVRLAERYKQYDLQNERKVHTRRVSRLGGIAVYSGFAVGFSVLTYLMLSGRIESSFQPVTMFAIFLGGTLYFLLGLLDDFLELSANFKFVIMVMIALLVVLTGVRVSSLFGVYLLPVWVGVILTVVWIVGIVNTINFVDGLDGLATGVGLLASIAFFIIAIVRGEWFTAFFLVCIIGALAGFLPFNFFPARIFLGDSGSLTIGYFLAVVGVIGLYKQVTIIALAVPLMILALPIADTAFAIVRRIARRVPVTRPDRRHIHHRILALFGRSSNDTAKMMDGPAHRNAVIACYVIAFVFASVAVYIGIQ